MIRLIKLFLGVLCPLMGMAQVDSALKVGDRVPDLVFTDLINHPQTEVALSDFDGKAVIIDFWATWCVPCVRAFPKLDALQRQFGDALQVMLVSNDSPAAIKHFYSTKPGLQLPTSVLRDGNHDLHRYFPHRVIPHYVWIGKDRRIKAITGGEQVTEEHVRALIDGSLTTLSDKVDELDMPGHVGAVIDSIEVAFEHKNVVSINPNTVYQSSITRYDPRLSKVTSFGRDGYRDRIIDITHASVVHLFKIAYGMVPPKQAYLELSDPNLDYPRGDRFGEMATWQKEHAYGYRVILNEPDSALRFRVMQRDLEFVFGLRAGWETRAVPCLVLRLLGDTTRFAAVSNDGSRRARNTIFGIDIQNGAVADLVKHLERYQAGKQFKLNAQQQLPILDETGYSGKFTLYMDNLDFADFDALVDRFKAAGLELRVEQRELKLLVIADR